MPRQYLLARLAAAHLLALGAWMPGAVAAQSVRLTVLDAVSGAPVPGASVTLRDGARVLASAQTDGNGRAEVGAEGAGAYVLAVDALGYRAFASDPVEVGDQEFVELRVRLGVDAIPLEPVEVVASGRMLSPAMAGFERRRADPNLGGSFLTRDAIERRPVATPTTLLRELPSVSIQPIMTLDSPYAKDRNLIWFPNSRGSAVNAGACLAEVYVDGVPVRQSVDSSLDDLVATRALAGVEVYPRPFSAPLEYRGTGQCGVVLFWTAEGRSADGVWSWKRMAVGGGLVGLLIGIAITR